MTSTLPHSRPWHRELRDSLRTAEDLVRAGLVPPSEIERYTPLLARYQFLLPRYYADLIDRQNPQCPIRLQAIPSLRELENSGVEDPLQDLKNQPVARITHRYPKRLLLHLSQNCSMYCRFCFRKTLLNEMSDDLFGGPIAQAVDYIRTHSEVEEVIFSGGDPLMASSAVLTQTLLAIEKIEHVARVRFHTRVPVTFPVRIDEELLDAMTATRFKPVVVTHFNHPKELTAESLAACNRLRKAGVWLLNQSVMLKGVNDDALLLGRLSRELFRGGILPYYLHHPDPAKGTAHFDLTEKDGLQIFEKLRADLPGYLVPRYVIDRVDRPYKSLVGLE